MKLKQTCAIILGLFVFSDVALADASQQFKNSCSSTTAKLRENINLVKYYVDDTKDHKGIYVISDGGLIWNIPGAQEYPDNYLEDSVRKAAMAAVTSNIPVHICSNEKTSPNQIWAIEIG